MAECAELAGIARRAKPFAPMEETGSCEVDANGMSDDWRSMRSDRSRSITVLFEDQWHKACAALGRVLPWTSRRSNFLIRGMPNPGAVPQRFRIGDEVVLEVTGICDPCNRMDRASDGLRQALEKFGRGGLTCSVIEGGNAAVGDNVIAFGLPATEGIGQRAVSASEVLQFWFEETPPEKQFQADPEVDRVIRQRFAAMREEALRGSLSPWEEEAESALALLIVLDQFSRNLFRGEGRAFEADAAARGVADRSIARGLDRAVFEAGRKFFYLPYMHSEDLADQDRCLELWGVSLPNDELGLYHARKHREVIAQFGRFPYRNAALGRETTADEEAFLSGGGYAP